MKKKNISEAIGNISQKYVNEATAYTGEVLADRPAGWMKWGAIAACFALVAVLSIGIVQGDLFDNREQVVTLDNGDKINFVKSDAGIGQLDIAVPIKIRVLTGSELKTLFHEIPVTAHAVLNAEDGSIIGLEGEADGSKLIVSTSNIILNDTLIIGGTESTSVVDGVSVKAGYFTNNQNAIYYATFKLGESTVYVEHAGAKEESETIKSELSAIIQDLIALEEIDCTQLSK